MFPYTNQHHKGGVEYFLLRPNSETGSAKFRFSFFWKITNEILKFCPKFSKKAGDPPTRLTLFKLLNSFNAGIILQVFEQHQRLFLFQYSENKLSKMAFILSFLRPFSVFLALSTGFESKLLFFLSSDAHAIRFIVFREKIEENRFRLWCLASFFSSQFWNNIFPILHAVRGANWKFCGYKISSYRIHAFRGIK